MSGKQRIGVLVGGMSGQRELSLRAGDAVVTALSQGGHDVHPVFVDRDIDLVLRQSKIDVAFLALRGRYGSDGCIQGLLEVLGIPYTGVGVMSASLAMNKAKTKEIFRLHNLPTAPAYVVRVDAAVEVVEGHGSFGFPVLVRPVGAGPAVGVSLARDVGELEAALDEAFRYDDEALVERFIEGRILSIAVLDGNPLGALELGSCSIYLGRGAAETAERVEPSAPGRLSVARYRSLLRLATQAYEALGAEGPALVDLVVTDRSNEVILDVDATPSLVPGGLYARIAQTAGLSFGALVEEILRGARLRAHGHKRDRRQTQVHVPGPERRAGLVPNAH